MDVTQTILYKLIFSAYSIILINFTETRVTTSLDIIVFFHKLNERNKSRSFCSQKTNIQSRDHNALDFGIIFVAYQNDTDFHIILIIFASS